MRRSNLLLPLCLVAVALAGCGQKGPLFMPPKPGPAPTAAKPAVPASVAPAPAPLPPPARSIPSNTNVPDGDQN
ncbi:MAG TPA: lipoprotein [Rhodanobacter sp.]